ncbi:hypothetical protein BU25DRAFT_157048 [Macroventuria anomochaeta]|uniref:Uncharacterized protein n=1 Tax=Macroventuria anomochaeta TaxID=301207 RepID=A0ACB6RTM3_9PLEO|nr:uncharacterized protein BU25DRAFT_157048 [Macroventuria anomochaeta]KAF2624279.1 hypothetical protein BU25DRAFT_157048 [Macroventuria anomochaeta]
MISATSSTTQTAPRSQKRNINDEEMSPISGSRSHVSLVAEAARTNIRFRVWDLEETQYPNIDIIEVHEHAKHQTSDAQRLTPFPVWKRNVRPLAYSRNCTYGCSTASPSWRGRCISNAFVGIAHRQPRGYQAIIQYASVSATNLETNDCLLI